MKWEYKVVYLVMSQVERSSLPWHDGRVEALFNELGSLRWELVNVYEDGNRAVFKRPKTGETKAD